MTRMTITPAEWQRMNTPAARASARQFRDNCRRKVAELRLATVANSERPSAALSTTFASPSPEPPAPPAISAAAIATAVSEAVAKAIGPAMKEAIDAGSLAGEIGKVVAAELAKRPKPNYAATPVRDKYTGDIIRVDLKVAN